MSECMVNDNSMNLIKEFAPRWLQHGFKVVPCFGVWTGITPHTPPAEVLLILQWHDCLSGKNDCSSVTNTMI